MRYASRARVVRLVWIVNLIARLRNNFHLPFLIIICSILYNCAVITFIIIEKFHWMAASCWVLSDKNTPKTLIISVVHTFCSLKTMSQDIESKRQQHQAPSLSCAIILVHCKLSWSIRYHLVSLHKYTSIHLYIPSGRDKIRGEQEKGQTLETILLDS